MANLLEFSCPLTGIRLLIGLFLLPYLHLCAWYWGGGGAVKFHPKPGRTTTMNIARPQYLHVKKRNLFPPQIYQERCTDKGKGCYGKKTVKTVAVLTDIEPSGTREEEIL